MKTLVTVVMIALLSGAASAANNVKKGVPVMWHDATEFTFEGRGWSNTPGYYYRLPVQAKEKVTDAVWGLASNTAGMAVRFITDSPEIKVRWKLSSSNLAMNHMAATGVSGVDLYIRHHGGWRWLGTGRPSAQENEAVLVSGLPVEKREYTLYLPLYNGLSSLEIGVGEGAVIEAAPSRTRDIKPVVFYGTSILQGGCASRPGMAYPTIIGRMLDIPTINLGFSGNGKMEPEMADLLAELDPSVYVIDPLPNMSDDIVDERIRYLLKVLHEKHPNTPVVLVENIIYQHFFIKSPKPETLIVRNKTLEKIYKDFAPQWNGRLYYVKSTKLLGNDGEGTVDGVHPTDLGFLRMAEVIGPVIKKALDNR